MAPSSTPCRKVNHPITMSASPKVQPGDRRAQVEDDEERDDGRGHPEDLDEAVEQEVGAVLHREHERGAELDRRGGAGSARVLSLRTRRTAAARAAT